MFHMFFIDENIFWTICIENYSEFLSSINVQKNIFFGGYVSEQSKDFVSFSVTFQREGLYIILCRAGPLLVESHFTRLKMTSLMTI